MTFGLLIKIAVAIAISTIGVVRLRKKKSAVCE
jgi:hypothetical protein